MLRLRTFGSLDLVGPDGRGIAAIQSQPKRLALLVYLVLAGAGRYRRRDTVAALFWPELDQQHARGALRQALRGIRAALGEGSVLNRGDEEIAVSAEAIEADAVVMETRFERGDLETGLELYQGEFLDGFHLASAGPEFESWLIAERARFQLLTSSNAARVARIRRAAGDRGGSVRWARRTLELAPDDESHLRYLLELLDEAGDRSSAFRSYEDFARRLGSQFEVAPSAETQALMHRIRTRGAPLLDPPAPPVAADPSPSPNPVPEPVRSRPGLRAPTRRPRLWVAALIAVAVVGYLGVGALGHPPALDQNLLVVAPFDVFDREHSLWRESMVDLLSAALDGAGPIRTVAPSTVVRWRGPGDRAMAKALGRDMGAGMAVFGQVVGAGGDSVRVTAMLLDVQSGGATGFEVRDLETRLDRIADSLVVRIIRQLGRTRPIAAVRFAGLGSSSLPALKAYLTGEQFYRRGDPDSAYSYFERAVSLDTGFALGWHRMSLVRSWVVDETDSVVRAWALRAGALNRGLPVRDSLLVAADSLYQAMIVQGGDANYRAHQIRLFAVLEEMTRRYPNDPEGWYQLGRARVYVPPLGMRMEDALDAIERAIQLDSTFVPAHDWRSAVALALRLDRVDVARHHLRIAAARKPAATGDGLRLAEGVLADSRASRRAFDRWLDTASSAALRAAAGALQDWPDPGETSLRLYRMLYQRGVSPTDSTPGGGPEPSLAYQLARRGHLRESFQVDSRRSFHVLALALLGGIPAETAAARFHWPKPNWWGAGIAWWADRRDTTAIRLAITRLDSVSHVAPPKLAREAWYDAARGRAYLALARGDTTEAIKRFVPLIDSLCTGCSWSRIFTDINAAAPLLFARGLDRQAERWLDYDSIHIPHPVFDITLALLRGRVAERLGKREKALAAYRLVAASWEHGDPAVESYVMDAKRAVRGLGSRP